MRNRFIVPVIAVLAAAAFAITLEPVTIKWTPKVGATLKYKLDATAKIEIPGQGSGEVTVKGNIAQKVTEVKDDQATVEQSQTDMDIRFMGESVGDVPASKTTVVMKLNGELISSKSDTPEEMNSPRMEMAQRFYFPSEALDVDGTWTKKIAKDDKKGTFTTEYSFKYIGMEEFQGAKCWKVAVTVKETDATVNMSGTGTVWLDARDGEMMKAVYDLQKVTMNEMVPPADMKASVTRVAE